jgi:nucleotide-binding universal stress UspA family protein
VYLKLRLYRHLLIPTDGSALAAKGVKAGVKLARALGARASGVYVIQPFLAPVYSEPAMYMTGPALADWEKASKAQAKKALAAIQRVAKAAGVRCATRVEEEMQPWRGILQAARRTKCDAIVMASHGRGGLGGAILGSQTSRVLAHSKLPVLVIR